MQSINSIYFEFELKSTSEVTKHNSLVNNESHIRNLSTEGTLEDKRCMLLTIMKKEYEFNSLLKLLNHANPDARDFYLVLTVLLCTLHSKMRIS